MSFNFYHDDLIPLLFALQETHSKDGNTATLKRYTMHNTARAGGEITPRGMWLFLLRIHIKINTALQAIAVAVTLHKVLSICSIYIPSGQRLLQRDLDNLVA